MFDSEGTLIGVLGIGRDLTERKRAEEELSQQKYFFEQMFMQSSISTQILDHEGWCERINPKLSELFGVKPKDIEGKVYNIFKDEAIIQGGIIPFLEKAFYKGKTADWEIFFDIGLAAESQHIRVKEKKKVWYKNWAYPIFDREGKLINVIIQHNDITEIKQAEQELIAAKDKAEESDRLKTAFLTNMSHELRTPLNGIMGYADLLTSQLDDPEQIEMTQGIFDSGKRLSETLNFILDLSKAETDTIEVIAKDVDVVPLTINSINSFSKNAVTRNLQLETIIKVENVFAYIDEHLFNRIIHNLLDNALKFTKKGKISVEIGKEVIVEKDWVYIKIKDTGIGITHDKIDLIWDEFRQVSEGLTRSYEGAGLGLTISKKAVELMKGIISVESELGAGSIFIVKLPTINAIPQKEELKTEKQEFRL